MLMYPAFSRFWSSLAPTTRAALWMLFGGFCAVMMNVLVRLAAQRMHPFEVTFFRCLFSLFLMLSFIIRNGPGLCPPGKSASTPCGRSSGSSGC